LPHLHAAAHTRHHGVDVINIYCFLNGLQRCDRGALILRDGGPDALGDFLWHRWRIFPIVVSQKLQVGGEDLVFFAR